MIKLKKLLSVLLALTFVFAFVACSGEQTNDTGKNTSNTSESSSSENVSATGEIKVGSVEWFNNEFFSTERAEKIKVTNYFLTSTYENVKDISLEKLIHSGLGDNNISDEEMKELKKDSSFNEKLDTAKSTEDEINTVLKKYTDITLEDIDKTKLNSKSSIYYLENYKAYYINAGDSVAFGVRVTSKDTTADGNILLKYETENATDEVVLKAVSDTEYKFISNSLNLK